MQNFQRQFRGTGPLIISSSRFNLWVITFQSFVSLLMAQTTIEGNDLESFKTVGWEGVLDSNSRHYDLPSLFGTSTSLETLDAEVIGSGVWTVPPEISPDAVIEVSYTFKELSNVCDVTKATVSVSYFSHHATAYLYPCDNCYFGLKTGDNDFCYFPSPDSGQIQWKTVNFELVSYDEVLH